MSICLYTDIPYGSWEVILLRDRYHTKDEMVIELRHDQVHHKTVRVPDQSLYVPFNWYKLSAFTLLKNSKSIKL